MTVGPSADFHERSLTIVSTEPLRRVISSRAIMRGDTAAPALGSVLASGLPEPVTVAPAACGELSPLLEGDAGAVGAGGADRGDLA